MRTAYIVAIGVVALFGPVQPNSALAADVTVRAQNSSAFTKSAPSRNKARPTNSRFSPPQRLAPPQNEPGQARQLQPEASTSAPQTSPNVIASEPPLSRGTSAQPRPAQSFQSRCHSVWRRGDGRARIRLSRASTRLGLELP